MNIRAILSILITAAALGCARERDVHQTIQTETIAPAPAQPGEGGTEEAMTQTVDIEDSRSENEGGVITSPNPPVRTGTYGTPPPPTATTGTVPPPQRRKR